MAVHYFTAERGLVARTDTLLYYWRTSAGIAWAAAGAVCWYRDQRGTHLARGLGLLACVLLAVQVLHVESSAAYRIGWDVFYLISIITLGAGLVLAQRREENNALR